MTIPTVDDVLRVVDEQVLTEPKRWTKWAHARTRARKDGKVVEIAAPNATCWCLTGAVQKALYILDAPASKPVGDMLYGKAVRRLADVCASTHLYQGLISFNDRLSTKFTDVKQLLRKARGL